MCPAFEMEQLIEGIQLLADNRSFFFLFFFSTDDQ
jgi:hypothetical protein